MKKQERKRALIILMLSYFLVIGLFAQSTTAAAGGDVSGIGGTVSYSLGQLVNSTNESSTGSVSQGVQQPYYITIIDGLKEATDIILMVSAYPNPTEDFLTLNVTNSEVSRLAYQLYDVNGKLLEKNKIDSKITNIEMRKFLPSTYFIKVIENSTVVKTFKIIKK